MSADLTLYLRKPAVTQIDNVIPADKRGTDGYEEVPVREGFEVEGEMACWVKNNEPKPAAWSKYVLELPREAQLKQWLHEAREATEAQLRQTASRESRPARGRPRKQADGR